MHSFASHSPYLSSLRVNGSSWQGIILHYHSWLRGSSSLLVFQNIWIAPIPPEGCLHRCWSSCQVAFQYHKDTAMNHPCFSQVSSPLWLHCSKDLLFCAGQRVDANIQDWMKWWYTGADERMNIVSLNNWECSAKLWQVVCINAVP